jgi:hypothetical protein
VTARKPDPVIAAWGRVQAAEKAWARAYDAAEEAAQKARAAGFSPLRPMVRVNGTDCLDLSSARRHARELPAREAAMAIEAMQNALRAWQTRRRAVGLAPFDAAEKRAGREWRAAMRAMADTRATTAKGVILKLKLIGLELRDGKTNYGENILASAIADLARMDRK